MRQSIALSYNPYLRLYHSWWSLWYGFWTQPFPSDRHHVHDIRIERAHPREFTVGDTASLQHVVELQDVEAFAFLTGDTNPVHLDETYARSTPFGERIAHGLYTASFFGTIFGTAMPGPGAIYVSQSLQFKAPVRLNDVIVADVKLVELLPKRLARFSCTARIAERVVLAGEAVLALPR